MTDTERRIAAAQGYIVLGLHAEARQEMAALPADARDRADVIELQVLCSMGEADWASALENARRLCALEKDEPGGFIHAAYCLHELGRTDEALATLKSGPPSLRKKAVYFYNLGCYSARLGLKDEALAMLEQAFAKEPGLRKAARKDPDLAALREQLQ